MFLFINENNIEKLFKKIINEYKSDLFIFIKYFYKNNFIKFNERIWNFNNNLLLSFDNPNLIFMTNNICESNNKYLNSKYHGVCKTFLNFEYAIIL